jgi:hypothetical protein
VAQIITCDQLVDALQQQARAISPNTNVPGKPARPDHLVARFFEEHVEEFPPNLRFIKFDKSLKRDVKQLIRS